MPSNHGKALLMPLAIVAATTLAGCNTLDRIGEVGDQPRLTVPQNPTARPGYRPVSLPMPAPEKATSEPNSLWRTGSRAFFKDQRASNVGDILTVIVNIDDKAKLNNSSTRGRANSADAAANAFLGYEAALHDVFPEAVDNKNLVNVDSKSNNSGSGKIDRGEAIKVKMAALITQVLPNGNLVIQGRQEVRVNYELRELEVAGIVRPEDIDSDNTIGSDKIAEARISYGGRGHLSDVQQPPIGDQLYDVIFPF